MSGIALWLRFCSALAPLQFMGWVVPLVVPITVASIVNFFARAFPWEEDEEEYEETETLLRTGGSESGSDSGESYADADQPGLSEPEIDRGRCSVESLPSLCHWISVKENGHQSGSSSGKGGRHDLDSVAAELCAESGEAGQGPASPYACRSQGCMWPTPAVEAVMAWDDSISPGEDDWKAGGEQRRESPSNSRNGEGVLEGTRPGSPVQPRSYEEPPSPAVGSRACCIGWPRKRFASRSNYARLPSLASCPETATASDEEGTTRKKHRPVKDGPALLDSEHSRGPSPGIGTDVTTQRFKSELIKQRRMTPVSIPSRRSTWGYKVRHIHTSEKRPWLRRRIIGLNPSSPSQAVDQLYRSHTSDEAVF